MFSKVSMKMAPTRCIMTAAMSFTSSSMRGQASRQCTTYARRLQHGQYPRIVYPIGQMQVRSMATYKTSTGLVGLAVDPDGRNTVLRLSKEIFERVKKIPEDAAYRKTVESTIGFIERTALATEDIKAIEDEVDLGQIEEVIEMMQDELELIDYYHENKVWELVELAKQDTDVIRQQMEADFYFRSPEARTL